MPKAVASAASLPELPMIIHLIIVRDEIPANQLADTAQAQSVKSEPPRADV